MPGKLKPYPGYSSCNLPWIKEIPSEWNLLKAKNVFDPIDIRSETGQEELLSVSEKHGVTPRKNVNVTMFKAESYEGYKMCWPGDLVINSLWAWMQGLGFSRHHGIISSAYGVYRLKSGLSSDFKFFDYLLKSNAYLWELRVNSKGIWRSRYQLTDESFFSIPIIIPPEKDRKQIICYLDWKTSQINRFIKAKKRLIELLKEQKQVIINDAVTGKIDVRTGKPYPKYKDSRVEWLGKVPEEWIVYPLKSISKSNLETLTEKTDPSFTFKYIEINNVKAGYLIGEPDTYMFKDAPSRARRKIHNGDTIISTVRTYLRSVYFFEKLSDNEVIVSTGFSVLTPMSQIMPKYLGYLIQSDLFINRVIQNSVGVSYPAIADSKLACIKIAIPSINEQNEIIKHIENKSKSIDFSIDLFMKEISLLVDYRTRLISDVVTGKVDVRNININAKDASDAMDEGVEEEAEINEIPESET